MSSGTSSDKWLSLDSVGSHLSPEHAVVVASLFVACWLTYRLLLKNASASRHRLLKEWLEDLARFFALALAMYAIFLTLQHFSERHLAIERLASYLGLMVVLMGAVTFIKACRMLVIEYLFLGHMKEGVPILLVNLLTLLLTLFVAGWVLTDVFQIKLAPLLATSAILSVVLGLALQDTLGNLFAGIALQFDKPYELGDWIEIHTGASKWSGQVHEITWRATVLLGLGDESLIVPNRMVSQAEISNFSSQLRPFIRAQTLRLPFSAPRDLVRTALKAAAARVPRVQANPAPGVFVSEIGDSALHFRLIYFIEDYGSQLSIGDQVLEECLRELERLGIEIPPNRMALLVPPQSPNAPAA